MYRFSAIQIKISVSYFVDMDKLILKFIWKGKRNTSKQIKENVKKNVRGLPD